MPESYDANAYSVRAATGVLAAVLAAGATVFSMRNLGAKTVYVDRVNASFSPASTFTVGAQFLFALERFGTATPSGGTAYTPMKHSSGSVASAVECRAATTAGLTMTSVVFDGAQVPIVGGVLPSNTAMEMGPWALDLNDDPIRLLPNEGLCVRNVVLWPAAGTGVFNGMVSWFER